MSPLLDTAAVWFFDSLKHDIDDALVVLLTEGIKGQERQIVEVADTKLGPYFPVSVTDQSRCVNVTFPRASAFFVYNESFDRRDEAMQKTPGRYLFEVERSSFRNFVGTRTTLFEGQDQDLKEYLLCCEDRLIHVLSEGPQVEALTTTPDIHRERTNTWLSN